MEHLTVDDARQLAVLSATYPLLALVAHETPLEAFLEEHFALSPTLAAVVIRRGGVWVDSQRVLEPRMLLAGQRLSLHTPPAGIYAAPVFTEAMILYEDQAVLVLNKPAGWFCVPTPWDVEGTLEVALRRFIEHRDDMLPPLHLVHRLDRDTSGALIVSKEPAFNSALQHFFNSGRVKKRYRAWCVGAFPWERHTLRTGHSRGNNGLWTLYPEAMIGEPFGPKQRIVREARTTFTLLHRYETASQVLAELHTGRTHQIRLHLAHLGYPILGDTRYDGPNQLGDLLLPHHLLHAAELQFPNPRTDATIQIEAPTDALWEQVEARMSSLSPSVVGERLE